ncbi:hypothetical protein ACFVT5_12715 [Streptomyces sp. NPDC058001]|uniref:hypothetical protein n=1 Tax=Streptomyces sp. NPDC058001 TaxID=3346300 RepID=UPI0036E1D040
MNRRSTLLTVATLTTAATLALSACGGDDKAPDDKISGAETSAKESATPSTSASEPAGAGRPDITLPGDLKLTFEGAKTGDAVKDAVLADNEQRMRAVDAAITGTDAKGEALAFYNTGKALEAALDWVGQFKKANATMTGEARYYDRTVTLKGKTSAVLTFCADESKGFSKDKKTGEISKTPVTKNSYVFYNTRLDKNGAGVWQTSQIISTRGASSCQP